MARTVKDKNKFAVVLTSQTVARNFRHCMQTAGNQPNKMKAHAALL